MSKDEYHFVFFWRKWWQIELFLCWHAWCIWRHCTLMHILSKTQNEETLWPILHAGGLPWLGYSVLQNACIDCYVPSDAVFCRWRDCPTRCTHISTRCTWLSSMPCEIVSIFRGELDGTMRIEMSFYCRVYFWRLATVASQHERREFRPVQVKMCAGWINVEQAR